MDKPKINMIGIGIMILITLFWFHPEGPQYKHQNIVEGLKMATVKDFPDPEASRFRNVRLYENRLSANKTIYILCGEVNVRGPLGYAGYKRFVMAPEAPSPVFLSGGFGKLDEAYFWIPDTGLIPASLDVGFLAKICEGANLVYREAL